MVRSGKEISVKQAVSAFTEMPLKSAKIAREIARE
jgi:hypothetical protein